jgi:hypothetical protein
MRTPLQRSIAQVLKIARAGGTFLAVPYRPILPRLDCHAWLSVCRPERRLGARLSTELHVVGRPGYGPT